LIVRAVSPDGRVWKVESLRERPSLAESREEPFFWAYVLVTLALVAAIVYLVIIDPLSPFLLFGALPLLIIWIAERGTSLLRPLLRAETAGPPPEVVIWKSKGRFGGGNLERRAVRAIEGGRPENDLAGLTLLRVESKAGA
jgi:hypothetical protein